MKKRFWFLGGVVIIIISFILIFYKFNQIPKNINYDEIDFAKLALSLDNKPYTVFRPLGFGHSTLYFYIILLSFKIFGLNNFALRLPSALFGVLNPLILYFILSKIFKQSNNVTMKPRHDAVKQWSAFAPFILSLVFLTSRWHLNFTRFSFEATFLLFLELVSIFFLISKSLFISGFFAGLAFNSYTPGRIFFLLPLFIIFLKTKKPFNHLTIQPLLYFLIPFIITILPLTTYLIKNPDPRISEQFFLKNEKLSTSKKIDYLLKNIKSAVLMFNVKGDMNGRHNFPGKPALNPILGSLFIIGLIITTKQWNNVNNRLFIFYFLLSLIPTFFTNPQENPNMLRAFTSIPSIIYFVGITISQLKLNKLIFAFLLFLIILSSIYELHTYFNYQSRVFRNSFEIICPVEKLVNKNKPYPKECLVSRNEF